MVILPGSRTQEVAHNLKRFLKAAAIVHASEPDARLAVAAFKPRQAERARRQVAASGLPVEVHAGQTAELIRLADCCMACSGSVSLELLYHARPTVVLYRISRAAYVVQWFLRKVKYITLVNLLAIDDPFAGDLRAPDPSQPDAESVLFPEYLTCGDKSAQIAAHVVEWLTDPAKREARIAELARLRDEVGQGGASRHAAEYILKALLQRPAPLPRPHFLPSEAGSRQRVAGSV